MMARRVVVEVDSREKQPLLFPDHIVWSPSQGRREMVRITTASKTLPFGDYRLSRYPHGCVVERKNGVDEICKNLCSPDRSRFEEAFGRFMDGCDRPVLMFDQALHSTGCLAYSEGKVTADDAMSEFWRFVSRYRNLWILWAGSTASPTTRTRLGAQLVRMMLAAAHPEGGVQ